MLQVVFEQTIEIEGVVFEKVRDRQRGVGVYVGPDRTQYLRIGSPNDVKKELSFHKQLLEKGFPIAPVIREGRIGNREYWIEESLGQLHFGDLFADEMREQGSISDELFERFMQVVLRFHDAQQKTLEQKPLDPHTLAQSVGFNDLLLELPDENEKMLHAWKKILTDLQHLPLCLTHGDFLPNNILEKGVIDLGDHFQGPVGYDMVNAITTSYWFPKETDLEYQRRSSFSEAQIQEYWIQVGTYMAGEGTWSVMDCIDPLFLLRAIWWTVRNDRTPKLQQWRYKRYLTLLDLYMKNESLYDYWSKHKDE